MTSMTHSRGDIIVGVDTHKDEHAAVTIDGIGGRPAEAFVPASNAPISPVGPCGATPLVDQVRR